MHRGTPDRADAIDAHAFEGEVVKPTISSRMKQRHDLPSPRVDSR